MVYLTALGPPSERRLKRSLGYIISLDVYQPSKKSGESPFHYLNIGPCGPPARFLNLAGVSTVHKYILLQRAICHIKNPMEPFELVLQSCFSSFKHCMKLFLETKWAGLDLARVAEGILATNHSVCLL